MEALCPGGGNLGDGGKDARRYCSPV